MKQRFALVILFALVVSGVASFVVYRLLAAQLNARASSEHQLIVATHNLTSGDLVKPNDLTMIAWSGQMPPGALTRIDDAINRGVVENIYQGEPVVDTRLAAKGAGAGLAATIPAGMRAVAVRVNDVAGVSGFVTPGMRVDILIAGNPPGGSNSAGTITKTLLQNIEVLSAGQNIQRDAEGKPVTVPVVNLLVTPEQAEVLSLASNEARIQLVLRNPIDKTETKTPGTTLSYLFTGVTEAPKPVAAPRPAVKAPPPPPPAVTVPADPPKPPPILVEVIHGSKKAETKFDAESTKTQEGNAK